MKALYCEDCGDIVAPHPQARVLRRCRCRRHVVWWEDPSRGVVRVCDTQGHVALVRELGGAPASKPKAWLLGITNFLLWFGGEQTPSAEEVQRIIDDHPDTYLFKKTRSLIVRFRPGQTSDSAWAVPEGFGESGWNEKLERGMR